MAARPAEPASVCARAHHLGWFPVWLLPCLLADPDGRLHGLAPPSPGRRPRPLSGCPWTGAWTAHHAGPGGSERLLLAAAAQPAPPCRGRARAQRREATVQLPCPLRAPLRRAHPPLRHVGPDLPRARRHGAARPWGAGHSGLAARDRDRAESSGDSI